MLRSVSLQHIINIRELQHFHLHLPRISLDLSSEECQITSPPTLASPSTLLPCITAYSDLRVFSTTAERYQHFVGLSVILHVSFIIQSWSKCTYEVLTAGLNSSFKHACSVCKTFFPPRLYCPTISVIVYKKNASTQVSPRKIIKRPLSIPARERWREKRKGEGLERENGGHKQRERNKKR